MVPIARAFRFLSFTYTWITFGGFPAASDCCPIALLSTIRMRVSFWTCWRCSVVENIRIKLHDKSCTPGNNWGTFSKFRRTRSAAPNMVETAAHSSLLFEPMIFVAFCRKDMLDVWLEMIKTMLAVAPKQSDEDSSLLLRTRNGRTEEKWTVPYRNSVFKTVLADKLTLFLKKTANHADWYGLFVYLWFSLLRSPQLCGILRGMGKYISVFS